MNGVRFNVIIALNVNSYVIPYRHIMINYRIEKRFKLAI